MNSGVTERNRYEIIAIFREEFRRRTDIEIVISGSSITTKISNLGAGFFSINMNPPVTAGKNYLFVLHVESGKVEFTTTSLPSEEGQQRFMLPGEIQILQRRTDKRLMLPGDTPFSCHGRYKNGKNYAFSILDISPGGCALLSEIQHTELTHNNVLLKQAIFSLDDYGELIIDLAVRNVSKINTIKETGQPDTCYKISCQFQFRSPSERNRIDKLVTELLMENKRKKTH
ncbi:putative type IV pilus assembly protein PilZ [Shimwellia blattae DSM 4481 = NBRC 105725]|uniref:Putative type IV pilus assembly protein PilZ n=2 Tax=Shimwellia blattae TaxID=563 RepID=I2B3S6_SHIBC|nr:PilZ domain-containing protein [Shimwellia blattae]AFJ45180.1 putative type IV pilus assembly protein PilZ [Shimwellia blattae DSM 4481 = NBRC 105725]VDY62661.1 Cyclic di-GMP binding protein YcgR [Shimwellia blattae]VEC19388.1 Cyclic di-GMP binding protein YcgR [Shimwellia blattae]